MVSIMQEHHYFLSFSGSELESYSSSHFAKGGACEKLHVTEIWDIVIEMWDLTWSEEPSESFHFFFF